MKTTASNPSRLSPVLNASSAATIRSAPWLMLVSRSMLFILFQTLIALVLAMTGTSSAWDESARWWTFIAILTNFSSIYLLVHVSNAEGKRYSDAIRFTPTTWKTDLLWLFVGSLIGLPIAAAPTPAPTAGAV